LAGDVAELEELVSRLLERERLGNGQGLRLAPLDLAALVRDVVERYREQPPGVRVVAAPASLPVEADAGGLRSVLCNVIENALAFSLPDSRPVEVTVHAGAGTAVVRVADDGCGISAEDLVRVFEPFFRTDPSRSRRTGGFGLGLSICKRILDAHRGSIAIERRDGRGVTVTIVLPSNPTGR
jgi:signal transduction histidine kinase